MSERDIIDELAEVIWAYGNDIGGQSRWSYADLDPAEKARFRADVIEAARRHPEDEIAALIIARSASSGTRELNAAEFAAAMQTEGERHNVAMQSIIDRESVESRWQRNHNPTGKRTSCQHARDVHTKDGCSRCGCLYGPDGRSRMATQVLVSGGER